MKSPKQLALYKRYVEDLNQVLPGKKTAGGQRGITWFEF